jgi:hypothetical protein
MVFAARWDIANDAISAGRDREDRKHPVAPPVDGDVGIGERISLHMDVGQDPIAVQRFSGEGGCERVAHNAVRPVAPGQPIGVDSLFFSVSASKRRLGAVHADFESRHFRASLDGYAQAQKPFFEQALGVGLGQHQRIWIRARYRIHADMANHVAVRRYDIDAIDLESRLGERRGPPIPTVEQFERAAPENDGFRFVCALRGLVDDPDGNPVPGEFASERQPHWPRADDQYGRGHLRS